MKANVFLMKCITNLHVGNGDVNYNIIDQEVERDPVTGLPMINASGVKGAIREFFEAEWGKNDNRIKTIFGGSDSDKSQGTYKFLQADLLFRPLRVSDNSNRSYVLTTTDEIINNYKEKVKGLGRTANGIDSVKKTTNTIQIEDETAGISNIEGKITEFTHNEVAVVKNLNDYDLPVIARNVLDDHGISKNLWYEEFVPHESIFSLIILTPGDMDKDFKTALMSDPVQFGGNASIGYGLMEIKEA